MLRKLSMTETFLKGNNLIRTHSRGAGYGKYWEQSWVFRS